MLLNSSHFNSNMMVAGPILAALLLIQVCWASPTTFITGGKDTVPGQYPYQVSIQYGAPPLFKLRPVCGGSIINENWILTSAQCLSLLPQRIGKVVVKAGKHELDKDSEYVQSSEVSLRLIHKDYKGIFKLFKPYDIGLLKLKTPLILNDRVKQVKLPKVFTLPNGTAVLTGWGSVSTSLLPKPPKVLQVANVTILTTQSCEDALKVVAFGSEITDIQFCTGPLDKTASACLGDSGDPLVQIQNGSPVQIGISSWAPYPCGKTGSPTVYTLVSAFVYWIQERITENY